MKKVKEKVISKYNSYPNYIKSLIVTIAILIPFLLVFAICALAFIMESPIPIFISAFLVIWFFVHIEMVND